MKKISPERMPLSQRHQKSIFSFLIKDWICRIPKVFYSLIVQKVYVPRLDLTLPWQLYPQALHRAAEELDVDLSRSAMVGDKDSDMQAALAAGIPHRYQVIIGEPYEDCTAVADLPDACRALLVTT